MSIQEKLNKSKEFKEKGNNAFKQNYIEKASILYRKVKNDNFVDVNYIKAVEVISSEELDSEGKAHLVNCHLNIAACKLKTNNPQSAIKAATKVTQVNSYMLIIGAHY